MLHTVGNWTPDDKAVKKILEAYEQYIMTPFNVLHFYTSASVDFGAFL